MTYSSMGLTHLKLRIYTSYSCKQKQNNGSLLYTHIDLKLWEQSQGPTHSKKVFHVYAMETR